MNSVELKKMMESILGAEKCAYYSFPEKAAPELPYLLYWFPSSNDEYADDKNYTKIRSINIELYSKHKDFEVENIIEEKLRAAEIPYVRGEQNLASEGMYEVLYESEVVIDG